jgi:hypothetical protein
VALNADGTVLGKSIMLFAFQKILGRNLTLFSACGALTEDSIAGINGNQNDDPSTNTNVGAVYIFRRNSMSWNQEAYLKPNKHFSEEDRFGASLSLDGDGYLLAG